MRVGVLVGVRVWVAAGVLVALGFAEGRREAEALGNGTAVVGSEETTLRPASSIATHATPDPATTTTSQSSSAPHASLVTTTILAAGPAPVP